MLDLAGAETVRVLVLDRHQAGHVVITCPAYFGTDERGDPGRRSHVVAPAAEERPRRLQTVGVPVASSRLSSARSDRHEEPGLSS